MAATVAILIVVKMLYQIKHIDHDRSNVNCTVSELASTIQLGIYTENSDLCRICQKTKTSSETTTTLLNGSV